MRLFLFAYHFVSGTRFFLMGYLGLLFKQLLLNSRFYSLLVKLIEFHGRKRFRSFIALAGFSLFALKNPDFALKKSPLAFCLFVDNREQNFCLRSGFSIFAENS